ncbi:MAG: hypothetical protein NTZ24_08585 [Deltaproteobacteria bacterium]|nr:hypothetical protein [Deltaproteobacteria bacterium]
MILLAGNAASKDIGMEGWQRMTLSDVVIPQKAIDMAGGNVKYFA